MRTFLLVIFSCLLGCIPSMELSAQCAAVNKAIQAGEELEYELKFNWKFIWVNAGRAHMKMDAVTHDNVPCFRSTLTAVSNKKVDFFFKMRDTLTCITTSKLEPKYFRKGAEEGSRYTVDEAFFSFKDDNCYVNQKRTYRDGTFKEKKDTSSVCVFDMLSILMQARSFDPSTYVEGQKILFQMATGRKVEEQTLIFRGRKVFKAEDDVKYRCLVFSLVEYTKKNKEKEVITFYITDDDNHLPVRLDLFLNFGSAKAFLTNLKGNRHPLTSIVKE